ncbi:MAG: DUF368 domain-containing protein [Bacteroidales bacterium]|nr:DUF368 domain-containing protein [Bacteroidales bacterium]
MKQNFILFLKGMAMGAADVVPGVSGGTIAFIPGIYQKLIDSIKSFDVKAIQLLFKGEIAELWKHVNGTFLSILFGGIFLSVLSLATLLKALLENHPQMVWSFFFGLIIASAIYVIKQVKNWNAGIVISLLIGVVIAYWITVVTPAETPDSWWFIILSGSLAICAMILPGISGSFILLLLGKYTFILTAVSEMKISVIALFMIGAAAGIISFSKLLSWLLHKYYNVTISLLAGFMIGSLNKVWPWKHTTETFIDRHGIVKPLVQENVLPGDFSTLTGTEPFLLGAVILAIVGFGVIFVIEHYSSNILVKDEQES